MPKSTIPDGPGESWETPEYAKPPQGALNLPDTANVPDEVFIADYQAMQAAWRADLQQRILNLLARRAYVLTQSQASSKVRPRRAQVSNRTQVKTRTPTRMPFWQGCMVILLATAIAFAVATYVIMR